MNPDDRLTITVASAERAAVVAYLRRWVATVYERAIPEPEPERSLLNASAGAIEFLAAEIDRGEHLRGCR